VLRKPNKDNYTISKAYKLIVFLNIIRKLLKLVITKRLISFIKNYNLLLNTQISAKRERFIKTALQLITKQIYII
jgi:hypothetical protein